MFGMMDEMVDRHLIVMRKLEQMRVPPQVISLFDLEYQKRVEEIGDVLDTIDFSAEPQQEDDRLSYFKSCLSHNPGRRAGSGLEDLLEEENKFNTSELSTINEDVNEFARRKILPAPKDITTKVSLWKILKDAVGQDITRISVPVILNDPLSMLQKIAETMEYVSVLDKAFECKDPVLRHLYVTLFYMSQYPCTKGRLTKPFNPILGETYEYVDPKFRLLSEQVSHHPPVSAIYV